MPWWLLALAVVSGPASVREREDVAFDLARTDEIAASTALLAALLREQPRSERACLWQEQVFLNAVAVGDPPAMWEAAGALIDRWHALRDGRGAEALTRVCREDVANGLRYLASRWHVEAEEACDRQRFALAEHAYRTFVAEFSDDPAGHEVAYHLGMLMLARARQATPGQCHRVTCGRAARAEQAERRRRGERVACGLDEAVKDEPAPCAWLRAARVAFVRALELDPHGEYASRAAFGQLAMAAAITRHDAALSRRCRTNSEGICVAEAAQSRGPACFEPTAACHAHVARPDRWPAVLIGGLATVLPPWRAP
jgi:hypothetical protein